MTIKLRSDGKFDVRVTKAINGSDVERRQRGIETKGEARHAEEALKAELIILAQKGWQHVFTWKMALDEYIGRSERKDTYATYSTKKFALEHHTSVWNDRAIDSIKRDEIEMQIYCGLDNAASQKKLLQMIRAVFKDQIAIGNLTANPCSGITYGKISEKDLIAMTREEIVLLLSEANKQNHPWYVIWRVMYELGLRSGEGLALKWSDISFQTGMVSISKAYCSKSKLIGPTKNRKTRNAALNPQLALFLQELKLKSDGSDFVLPQFTEWKRGEAAKTLKAFQIELGIRETNFHSLRASFITHLLLKGVPITKVQYMVGHADLKTTQRYVRLVGSDIQGATDLLGIELTNTSEE